MGGGLLANRSLRPHLPTPEKLTTYESGVDPVGEGWAQSYVRYYVFAYLYVIFAVDAVFLFPWATVFDGLGAASIAEMGASSRNGPSRSRRPATIDSPTTRPRLHQVRPVTLATP